MKLGGAGEMMECRCVLKSRCEYDALLDRKRFRMRLARWFKRNAADYPWRRTHDAYEVLVSEVMLQQTQIATVLGKGYYQRFLDAFPDMITLAAADDAALLKAWEGLGYYRRARMLRDTARAVIERHDGKFPCDAVALLALPGIGRYTAGALRAFAFNLPAVLVDGNVCRVLARLMDFSKPVDGSAGLKQIWEWAAVLADDRHPRIHHAALMELGQKICRPGVPDCTACPVAAFCRTREPAALPVKQRKVAITAVDEHALWLRDKVGRVLMQHETGKRRTGLWKLPVRDAGKIGHLPVIAEHVYGITRYRVRLRVHQGRARGFQTAAGEAWIEPEEIAGLAMAAPFRRVLEGLLADL
jgi:A/G-specific adenine glycosylase